MDMIVNLMDERIDAGSALPDGLRIIRPMTSDRHKVAAFIRSEFGEGWASETETAFSRQPVSCFIAVNQEKEIVGFAGYDCTARAFFGPTGVSKNYRKKGIGAALLLASLRALRELGYAYGVIGDVGEHNYAFYHNACGAEWISNADAEHSIYRSLVK